MSHYFLTNAWGERYLQSVSRHWFEHSPSTEVFDRMAIADFNTRDTLFLVIGSDSGLLPPYVAKKSLGPGSRVVFIEPDDIYESLSKQTHEVLLACGLHDDDDASTSSALYRESDWESKVFDGSDTPWFLGGKVQLVQSLGCEKDYTQAYLPLYSRVRTAMANRQFSILSSLGVRTFIEKQIENAADNIKPLMMSEDFGRNCTAIVLGGSPSLNDHLDWIITHRNQLFIIAVSRISEKLSALGLEPDIVVSIDPLNYCYDVSRHGVLWTDVPLICSYHVAPPLLRQWQGPVRFLGDRLPWPVKNPALSGSNISAGGPTVSHTATVVASQLGFTTILLCGVDLCYSADIQTHGAGSPEAVLQSLPSLYDAQVETYSGQLAGTNQLLLQSVPKLTQIGQLVNAHAEVLFNLSKNAARITSIPLLSREQVKLPEKRPDIHRLIDDGELIDMQSYLTQLRVEMTQARQGFLRICRACKRAQTLITRLYDDKRKDASGANSRKLDKLERTLEKEVPGYLLALKQAERGALSTLRRPSGFTDMHKADMQSWIRSYYHTLASSAKRFMEHIDSLEPRIQLRCDELNPQVTFDSLRERWQEDESPGRVLQWLCNSRSRLQPADRTSATDAAQRFIDNLHKQDTQLARTLKAYNNDIDHCMRSLIFLFNKRCLADLTTLSQRLDPTQWPGGVLQDFSNGLCSELSHDPASALSHYQSVIDTCSLRLADSDDGVAPLQRIIEESLVRMTQSFLALHDRASACSTLGTLCEMLPQYMVPYARLLNLCGNPDSAIELLQCYLQHIPQNRQASMLLAEIYSAQGHEAKALDVITASENRQHGTQVSDSDSPARRNAA